MQIPGPRGPNEFENSNGGAGATEGIVRKIYECKSLNVEVNQILKITSAKKFSYYSLDYYVSVYSL